MKFGYLLILKHYTKEDVYDVQCFCLSKTVAERERERIQNIVDPEYNEWYVDINPLVEIIE